VAPALVPVFVLEPAPQVEQEATFDDNEYKPGVHSVHVDAPPLVPVFVLEPAPQVEHDATFDDDEYRPGVHSVQTYSILLAHVALRIDSSATSKGSFMTRPRMCWILLPNGTYTGGDESLTLVFK
jgi:hypothetical protein